MSDYCLAIGTPSPLELIILILIAAIGIAFVFLLFRALWRVGSPRPNERQGHEG